MAGAREYPPLLAEEWQSDGNFEIINSRVERDFRAPKQVSEYMGVLALIEAELMRIELLKP